MQVSFVRALVCGAALVIAAVLAPATADAAEQKQTNSAKLAKPLKEAHDALNAKKYQEAVSKLREAENTAGKTPYDQHLINDMLAFALIDR
jgi:outer membrane protein assembly factor BamD (BamD/ComL family)